MKCYARWREFPEHKICIRDQTILQFGNSWDLRASFVLFNPGSAAPKTASTKNEFLTSLNLPYLIGGGTYHEFSLDPLMRNMIKAAASIFDGGAIQIYNLFNIKNSDAQQALENLVSEKLDTGIYTPMAEVNFLEAPVVIACGRMAAGTPDLEHQLTRYVEQAKMHQLHGLLRVGPKQFAVRSIEPNMAVQTYHPSYTFHYGNKTDFSRLISRREN